MAIDIDEIVKKYQELLILQYADKDNAKGEIELFAKTALADGIYWDILDGYNIETAIGKQLDILGKYIGLDRFYEGSSLSDEDYRFLLKLKIAKNNTNHSTFEIATDLDKFFENDVILIDNYNMSINYFIDTDLLNTAFIARDKNCFPRPIGVGLGIVEKNDYFVFAEYEQDLNEYDYGFSDYTDANIEGGNFFTYDNIL